MSRQRTAFVLAIWLALSWLAHAGSGEYFLNGKAYPVDVAPPYQPLPQLLVDGKIVHMHEKDGVVRRARYPIIHMDSKKHPNLDIIRAPRTNDVLKFTLDGKSVTGRVVSKGRLVCSNGMETDIQGLNIQRLFQLIAETHIMLNTPQQPVGEPKPIVVDPITEIEPFVVGPISEIERIDGEFLIRKPPTKEPSLP